MTVLFIYLIGCLLGFGITHTFTIPYKTADVSNFRMYIYGTFCSWLTVSLFVYGLFKGLMWGGKDED